MKWEFLVALILFSVAQATNAAPTPWSIILGDSNAAPVLTPRVVHSNLNYESFSIRDVSRYGVLVDVGLGMYANRSRALVIPFGGQLREIDLRRLLKGEAIEVQLDDDGTVFVETQIEFGCKYLVHSLDTKDNSVWSKSFDSPYKCEGGDSWGISATLFSFGNQFCVEYYERKVKGEFSVGFKSGSQQNYCLTDKAQNLWVVQTPNTVNREPILEFKRAAKGDQLIAVNDWGGRKLGTIKAEVRNNPKFGSQSTRLVGMRTDLQGRLFATYETPSADAPVVNQVVVIYSAAGAPLGRYDVEPLDRFTDSMPDTPFGERGEWYFARKEKGGAKWDLLVLEPKN